MANEKRPRPRSVIERPDAVPAFTGGSAAAPIAHIDAEPIVTLAEPVAPFAPSDLIVTSEPVATIVAHENVYPATPPVAPAPEPATKEKPMNETYTTAADAMKDGAEAMKSSMASHTENAMATGKATLEQVATKSREAMEQSMKHVDEMAGLARGNVEAMLASSRAATSGIEAIAREVAEFSRKAFEETTAAARAMTTVKTPNELMALQNDFAKTQFDAAVAEMSKLSETMVKLMGEVFEPMQARATVATDKVKAMVSQATNAQ